MATRHQQIMDGLWRGMLQRHSSRATPSAWQNELLNWWIRGGVPVSRPAIRPFHGAPFPLPVRGCAFHVTADGVAQMLVASGTKLYRLFQGGDPIELSMASLPVAEQTRTEQEIVNFLSISGANNTTFIFDGVNPNLKWDGTVLTRQGIEIPDPPAAPVDGAGLIEAGVRNYVITLVSPYSESSPSNESSPEGTNFTVVTQLTNGHSQTFASPVQGVDFDDPQIITWRLWRTSAGGSIIKFIGEADIGLPIVDNVPDTELIGRDPVEELVADPPPGKMIACVEHRGQLIAVFDDDPQLLRFTNIDPDYMVTEGWPRNYVQPVAHGDGDQITALASFFEWCVVFKNNSAYAVIGDSFDTYRIVPILASASTRQGIGCFAPGSIVQVENELQWVARDGIYSISRFTDPSGGLQATRISGPIDDLFAAAKYSLGSSSFFDRKKRLTGFDGHG